MLYIYVYSFFLFQLRPSDLLADTADSIASVSIAVNKYSRGKAKSFLVQSLRRRNRQTYEWQGLGTQGTGVEGDNLRNDWGFSVRLEERPLQCHL